MRAVFVPVPEAENGAEEACNHRGVLTLGVRVTRSACTRWSCRPNGASAPDRDQQDRTRTVVEDIAAHGTGDELDERAVATRTDDNEIHVLLRCERAQPSADRLIAPLDHPPAHRHVPERSRGLGERSLGIHDGLAIAVVLLSIGVRRTFESTGVGHRGLFGIDHGRQHEVGISTDQARGVVHEMTGLLRRPHGDDHTMWSVMRSVGRANIGVEGRRRGCALPHVVYVSHQTTTQTELRTRPNSVGKGRARDAYFTPERPCGQAGCVVGGLLIRTTVAGDRASVLELVRTAFATGGRDGHEEVDIVEATWKLDATPDGFDIVATEDGTIVGHVLGAWGRVDDTPVLAVAPLAVVPDHHGRGIGRALMTEFLRRAEQAGSGMVALLGSPAFYGRFGFEPSAPLGITYRAVGENNPHFQVRRLTAYDAGVRGDFVYCWEQPAPGR